MTIITTRSSIKPTLQATTLSAAVLAALSLTGCQTLTDAGESSNTAVNSTPATLYYNGDIITMEGNAPKQVEALVEQDGKIAYVGSLKAATDKYKQAAKINLNKQTLLPGFIDPHSHFGMVSNTMGQVNLNPPPIGDTSSISDMMQTLKDYKAENDIADGEWIFGYGYDETQLKEGRHPTKSEIDKVLPNNPVYLQHTSGHMGVANSAGLKEMKVTAKTKNPDGGIIDRVKGSNEPNGLVQETAMYPFVRNMLTVLTPKQAEFFDQTQDYYAAYGVTTAQDGSTTRDAIKFFQSQADAGKLKIDLVSLAGVSDLEENLADKDFKWQTYQNGFKVQGTKIVADGSPQGKTAYFSQPYLTEVPGCDKDCKGLPSVTQDELNKMFVMGYANDNQLFIHNNGDGATDMILTAHKYASEKTGQALDKDRRTVPVHAQFARQDQLDDFKKYKMLPSFFTNHTFFWGDVHVKNLGKDRAYRSSPLATADKMGLLYTNHSDDTVTPIDPMFGVWSAVNRVSRSGQVIGPDERATPYQALKAITTNAAFEYFEEDSKGTLTAGKRADLVILDKNPLTVAPTAIKGINVMKTIKDGKVIFDSTNISASDAAK